MIDRNNRAGQAGSHEPADLAAGDNPAFSWSDMSDHTGLVYQRSQVRLAQVRDGSSNTYMVGEKYLDPDHYSDGLDVGDNLPLYCSQQDVRRWAYYNESNPAANLTPKQDRPGFPNSRRFGSAHSAGCGFVFCDGSVRVINHSIDSLTHNHLGNRRDGQVIDVGKL